MLSCKNGVFHQRITPGCPDNAVMTFRHFDIIGDRVITTRSMSRSMPEASARLASGRSNKYRVTTRITLDWIRSAIDEDED